MSIIRVKKDKNYFAASNKPFNDKQLSWEARGVMGYLLSKPDEWRVRFYDLVQQGPAGEHKIRRILKELEELGYMERERIKTSDGKFDWITTVYETSAISRLPIYGLSTDGSPTGGVSTDGKPRDITSTELASTELISTEPISTEEEEGANIFLLYEEYFGLLTKQISDELMELEKDYAYYWIKEAFEISKKNDAKSLNYAKAVLRRMKDNGFKKQGKKKTIDMSAFDQVKKEMEEGTWTPAK